MKKGLLTIPVIILMTISASAADFADIPRSWKWISDDEVIFSYDGTYTDSTAFAFNAGSRRTISGVSAPEKYAEFPLKPDGAVNMTYSPDSSMIAFTRENDLYVIESTSPIGTTEMMAEIIFNERPELKGKIYIAYCPERVLPGNVIYELVHNDRIIGGINQESTEKGIGLFDFAGQFVAVKHQFCVFPHHKWATVYLPGFNGFAADELFKYGGFQFAVDLGGVVQ